jgi:D-alanyl-D-alanine carboxypeptidase (penicillin-binding protein 5/6)
MATHDLMTRWGLARLAAAVMLALGLVAGPLPPASATAGPAGPKVTAHSAILVDIADGSVLWQRNPTVRRAPASLTKMLTALTVKASLPMTRRLIVSPSADRTEANRLGLGAGHDISVAQALTALMMISANDMGVVLALHAAGSIPRFSLAMDLESRHLGLTGSTWRNPHGLDAKGHLSTAFDLAILARAILRDPWLAEVASRRGAVSFVTPDGRRRALYNKGHFLHGYRGAIGVKTGFTDDAGRCVAAAARRGNRTLVAVVLRSADPAKDAAALMDWGFGPGRTVRTSTRLPPYVAPVSVKALLEPGAADPVAAQGHTPATTPAPTPAAIAATGQAPAGTGSAGALSAAAVVIGIILMGVLTVRARRRAIRTVGTGPEPDDQVPTEPPRPPGHDLVPPGGRARRRRRLRL